MTTPILFLKADIVKKISKWAELRKERTREYTRLIAAKEAIRRRQTISYKGLDIFLGYDPRIGVCNICRAVRGWDCSKTVMHHELYDDSNPLAHTIEVCIPCHYGIHHIHKPTIQKENCSIIIPHK